MTGASEDLTELRELVAFLQHAGAEILPEGAKVVAKGALNVKKDSAQRISGHPHVPLYPQSIGYDTTITKTAVQADIGPDKAKPQGALGNILEYGTENNPPIPHLGPALDAEEPRFVDQAEALVLRLLAANS